MKGHRLFLLLASVLISQMCMSQKSLDNNYDNVISDLTDGQNFTYFLKHKISMPGVWGLGGNVQYMMKHIVYAEVEAGYGWVIGDNSNAPESFKKFRGWLNIKAGYPIFSFTKKKSGKWVTGQSNTHDYYFRIDVPAHYSLIALAGFTSEPTSLKANAVERYSFQAPVYTLGLKWLSYLKARVNVEENTGSVQRKFEFYAGIIIPSKNEILSPEGVAMVQKTEKLGYEFIFSFPYRLNGWATFDLGLRSLGYNDNGQIYIGNTFYF
jgi:hypothetical protein